MASSFWTEDKYRIHFFCALCGGPFARVYRTDKIPDYRREESPASYDGTYDDDNTCTVPKAWNKRLSDDALRNNALPLVENEPGESWSSENQVMRGSVGDSDEAWRAYSGRHIHDEDMKWTKIMRALIHRHAQVHPEGGLEQLDNERDVYLTGRGRVLENGSWAVAYPSIVDELERDDDNGITLGDRSPFRFHLYQEPDRTDRKFHISSIPFHEECCDILGEAVLSAQWERGLEITAIENVVSWERFWSYLCDMIPTAVTGGLSDLTSESLASGTAEDPIQRLSIGCMGRKGYREAQRCADGSFWRHIKGLHVGTLPSSVCATSSSDDSSGLLRFPGNLEHPSIPVSLGSRRKACNLLSLINTIIQLILSKPSLRKFSWRSSDTSPALIFFVGGSRLYN